MNYLLAFDTETGGLDPKDGDLLTIYAAIIDQDFKIMEELDLKLKPDGDRLPNADAGALRVNGINIHDHMKSSETITYSEAKVKFVTMIKKYLQKKGRYSNIRPMGYNLPFDIKFVQHYLIPNKEWDEMINYNTIDPKVVVNFLKDCSWLPPETGTLISMVKYFDISMGTAHTAKADTLATVEVYKKMLDLMASKKEGGNNSVDLITLLEAE